VIVAQISDPHVASAGGKFDRLLATTEHLTRAVAHLNALRPRPDVVLLTGDLVEHGRPDEYRRLRDVLAPLAMPVLVIPGNHDDRANLVRAFDDHAYLPRDGGFLQYTVDDWPVRLVALDTVVPGESGGRLCADRLAWLDARLGEAPGRPTLVFMHHPPFATGIVAMDAMGLEDPAALAAVLRRHPHVEGVACGHIHRTIVRRFAGTVAAVCPSTAHQVALDLPPERRLAVVMEPPACLLHVGPDGNAGLVTHVSPIDDSRPPFVVYDGEHWLADAKPPPGFRG